MNVVKDGSKNHLNVRGSESKLSNQKPLGTHSNFPIASCLLLRRILFISLVFAAPKTPSQAFVVTPSTHHYYVFTKVSNKSPALQQTRLFAIDEHATSQNLSHSDIEWRLRPPEGTSRFDRLKLKLGANLLRLDCKLKGGELPHVLCPRGGRALLEAYYKGKKHDVFGVRIGGERELIRFPLPLWRLKILGREG